MVKRKRKRKREKKEKKKSNQKKKKKEKIKRKRERELPPYPPEGGSRNKFRPELTRAYVCVREVITYRAVFHTECRVTTKAT